MAAAGRDAETHASPWSDPARWTHHVRMRDRTWLCRPERVEGEAQGNAPVFSRRIPDCWAFDDKASAVRAALSHGATPGEFDVIAAPRDAGAWLAESSPEAMAARMRRRSEG